MLAAKLAEQGVKSVWIPSKKQRPDMYYSIDGHWHSGGHLYVAEQLIQALRSMIGCSDSRPIEWIASRHRDTRSSVAR
jgi:hypothetical protein